MICPAYQSAFIYDKDALRKRFSYFQEDSTPKIYAANKTKYLIAETTTYKKKTKSLQTVPMRPVNVAVPDSFKISEDALMLAEDGASGEDGVDPGSELDAAARSVVDSTFIVDVPKGDTAQTAEDSVYVISVDKEVRVLKYDFPDSLVLDSISGKYVSETPRYAVVHVTFNVDQDNYMWYLRDYLVLPDVRQARIQQEAKGEEEKSSKSKKKKQGIKGFFKNLFKKKKKEEPAPVEETVPPETPEEEEFDFIDEESSGKEPEVVEEPQPEKKGLFGRKKKDKKERKKEEPPKEEEEEKPAEEPVKDPEEKTIPEKVDEDGF